MKFAFRQLLKNPGLSAVAVVILALCLGVNLTIYAVVDALLLEPLPFPEPHRLVITAHSAPGAGIDRMGSSLPNYFNWRESLSSFESTAASQGGSVTVSGSTAPMRVPCERVSPEFFDTLGVRPAVGRLFDEEGSALAGNKLVVVTDRYWRENLNADRSAVGRHLRIDGESFKIIGVLPPEFRYFSSPAQLYFSLSFAPHDRDPGNRNNFNSQVVARLAAGATLRSAQMELDALDQQQLEDDPQAQRMKAAGLKTHVFDLQSDRVRKVRPILLLLQWGAMFLLVIGIVNLGNLLLVRASSRAKDYAIRRALGADASTVAREVLTETMLMSGIGGLLGIGLAGMCIGLIETLGSGQLPPGTQLSLSARVSSVAALVALFTGLLLAAPVIWFHLRSRLGGVLKTETRTSSAGPAALRLRRGLVAIQITLAFVLLSSASLLGTSFWRVISRSPGFQTDHLLSGHVDPSSPQYRDPLARLTFIENLLGDLRARPEVTSAAIATFVPLSGSTAGKSSISAEAVASRPGDELRSYYRISTVGNLSRTLGIPLRKGRFLEDADNHREQKVCVVDEALARHFWPSEDAIGRRIALAESFDETRSFTIVGVVGSVLQNDLTEGPSAGAVYLPYRHDTSSGAAFHVMLRTKTDPSLFYSSLRRIVWNLDPELPVNDLRSLQDRIDDVLTLRRLSALIVGVYAAAALLLAALGLYGTMSCLVSQRTNEFGIRMAMGASRREVQKRVIATGCTVALSGLALGFPCALASARLISGMIFGISVHDPATFVSVSFFLICVMLITCTIPAVRAARIDPWKALRQE